MKKSKNFKYTLLTMGIISAITSCKVTKNYIRPDLGINKDFRDIKGSDNTTIANLPWKTIFTDTVLQKLIIEGLQYNLDLKTAVASMQESAASFKQSKAAFFPSLSTDGTVTATRASGLQGNNMASSYITYQAELSSTWQVDIWGKLKSSKNAAYDNLLASDAYRRAVLTELIASIANDYYQLLAYDQELAITEQTLTNRTADVKTVQTLKNSDVVTGADVVESIASRYSAALAIPDLKVSIRELENSLSLMLGRNPGPVERLKLTDQQPITMMISIGLPVQLLSNRPDVQQAEFNLMNALENTNVARTNFYPALTLTASGGLSKSTLINFFSTSSLFGNAIAGLTQPIFNNGANKAALRIAQAEQQAALFSFQKSLLTASGEVSNALFSYQMAQEKASDRAAELQSLEKAVNYTKQLLKYTSATNYTDVLTAEQNLLTAQLAGVNDRLQELQGIVNLYQALGGGWK